MINKEIAGNLFDRHSCLINDKNVIPKEEAENLTSKEGVEFSRRMNPIGHNGYGIGSYTLNYLTREAFFIAVTYQNIDEFRKAGASYETD